ncbi:MAG: hypothetical protein JNK46_14245 [Methylobacteriaceae bacterium]|nr:hypothetical protein [Methylobacteriaceae bacterium]
MTGIGFGPQLRSAMAATALAALLAGCGGGAPTTAGGGASSTLATLIAFNTPSAPPAPAAVDPNARKIISCPEVEVLDGGGALRVGGPGAGVRHQFSMGEVVRECQLQGGQIAIRVGLDGNLLIGPAGGPGSFSAPVRIAIRRESDQAIVASRVHRVAATVPSGGAQAPFQLIAEPLTVPFVSEEAGTDYSVLVQFGGAGAEQRERRRRRR